MRLTIERASNILDTHNVKIGARHKYVTHHRECCPNGLLLVEAMGFNDALRYMHTLYFAAQIGWVLTGEPAAVSIVGQISKKANVCPDYAFGLNEGYEGQGVPSFYFDKGSREFQYGVEDGKAISFFVMRNQTR